ncbi:MAG: hypothetical protein U0169_13120 [Polyangiaceae bacterium]
MASTGALPNGIATRIDAEGFHAASERFRDAVSHGNLTSSDDAVALAAGMATAYPALESTFLANPDVATWLLREWKPVTPGPARLPEVARVDDDGLLEDRAGLRRVPPGPASVHEPRKAPYRVARARTDAGNRRPRHRT